MMKYIILVLAVFSQILLAEPKAEIPKGVEINDEVGTLKLEFAENHEPAWYALGMKLTLTCKDRRRTPNQVKPVEQELPIHRAICQFTEHSYNDKEKVLTLKYVNHSNLEDVDAECDNDITYSADLKTLCKAWAP